MQGNSAITAIAFAILASAFGRAETESAPAGTTEVVISIPEEKLVLLRDGMRVEQYKVSTSKFGAGDSYGSYKTPLGKLKVCEKIGEMLPCGSVIKHRNATGEVLPVNSPGRDPIVTRIIWLDGLEEQNKNAKARGIYIHGTVEESKIGSPVSYGCIRMRSREVMELFEQVPIGTVVTIMADKLPKYQRWTPPAPVVIAAAKTPPAKPAGKPATETVAEKPAPPMIAEQLPANGKNRSTLVFSTQTPPADGARTKPAATAASQPAAASKTKVASAASSGETTPRVTLADNEKRSAGDPGAAEALHGSMLFADLPAHAPAAPKSAPAPEPVAEVSHAGQTAEVPMPRVTFRTGSNGSVVQRMP